MFFIFPHPRTSKFWVLLPWENHRECSSTRKTVHYGKKKRIKKVPVHITASWFFFVYFPNTWAFWSSSQFKEKSLLCQDARTHHVMTVLKYSPQSNHSQAQVCICAHHLSKSPQFIIRTLTSIPWIYPSGNVAGLSSQCSWSHDQNETAPRLITKYF